MNVIDAAHHTIENYEGGATALATRLLRRGPDGKVIYDKCGKPKTMSAAVLSSKVNQKTHTHHLTLAEANQIMALANDHLILHVMAAEHGYTLQRITVPEKGGILEAFLSAGSLKGKLATLLAEALHDGRITPNEARAIAAVCGDTQAVLVQVAQHARCAAERGMPV